MIENLITLDERELIDRLSQCPLRPGFEQRFIRNLQGRRYLSRGQRFHLRMLHQRYYTHLRRQEAHA